MSSNEINHGIATQCGSESGKCVYMENGAQLVFVTFIQNVPSVKYFQAHFSKPMYGKFCNNVTTGFVFGNQLRHFYLKNFPRRLFTSK